MHHVTSCKATSSLEKTLLQIRTYERWRDKEKKAGMEAEGVGGGGLYKPNYDVLYYVISLIGELA